MCASCTWRRHRGRVMAWVDSGVRGDHRDALFGRQPELRRFIRVVHYALVGAAVLRRTKEGNAIKNGTWGGGTETQAGTQLPRRVVRTVRHRPMPMAPMASRRSASWTTATSWRGRERNRGKESGLQRVACNNNDTKCITDFAGHVSRRLCRVKQQPQTTSTTVAAKRTTTAGTHQAELLRKRHVVDDFANNGGAGGVELEVIQKLLRCFTGRSVGAAVLVVCSNNHNAPHQAKRVMKAGVNHH